MNAGTLEVYNIFTGILDREKAGKVVSYIENVNETAIASYVDRKMENVATKADLIGVEAGLEVKIERTKAELIKWMFIFWVTQTLTILGLLAYFLKQ